MTKNSLYYGDNLDILRNKIQTESVDLCYIDPPFNSKKNYNQIYNNKVIGRDDLALSQAFIDTWVWDTRAAESFEQILTNHQGRFQAPTIDLIQGLRNVLKEGSLLAYIVSMTLRITEIFRVLKRTGSFYLHCDPTASHYLKLVLDSVFCSQGGDFRNEIIWHYLKWSVAQRQFVRNHDSIFFYSKSEDSNRVFNTLFVDRSPATKKRFGNAKILSSHDIMGLRQPSQTDGESEGVALDDVWDISRVPPIKQLYPTEKPFALLERIIAASSNEGDLVLDAYCGCGTTIEVAHKYKRRWMGIDITYQSISVILNRLERAFTPEMRGVVALDGIPRDMASATALANKQDDRVRKEFEKWAVLTYSDNRATINQKKGADGGIDGTAYFVTSKTEHERIIFQVKSGHVGPKDIRDLRGTMEQQKAPLGIFLTLANPTSSMMTAAHSAGTYRNPHMERNYNKIEIITIEEMLKGTRLSMPLLREVAKQAEPHSIDYQPELLN